MHSSQIALCAAVLLFLQAVAARPAVNGPEISTGVTAAGARDIDTIDGEVVSDGNGTEIQSFPNTTSSTSSGTNWSLRYWESSLPRLQSQSPILPQSKLVTTMSHSATT